MIELLTPREAAIADRAMVAAGTSIATLMQRAGYAIADALAARAGYGVHIVVLAGPGDNGGDAFVAAEVLRRRGFAVALVDMSGGKGGEAATGARREYRGEVIATDAREIDRANFVIDGLFGGGLTRPLEGAFATLVERVNQANAKVLAIDLPSGVDGATGNIAGPAVEADFTATFERRKPGHLLLPGRAHCGMVGVDSIGMTSAALAAPSCKTFANDPQLWRSARPRLALDGHKYSRGHVVIVSGKVAATGASRLCASAALRAGAGLVSLASPPDALLVNASHLTTVMLRKIDGPEAFSQLLADERLNAVCLGPGLEPDAGTRALAKAALSSHANVVLDAGALTAFAGDGSSLAHERKRSVVLTPHEGEFARLFGRTNDKLADARSAAAKSGAVVVLKGADTVVAAPDGRAAINANAPPWLATAGSGDILAGIVTAQLAQGMPAFEAACFGVWLHGEAANEAGAGMIADDLLPGLRVVRASLDQRLSEAS
ncbi:MAG: NAD(P)H-hydrate dehydratase [Pseudomonadota bacterium]